MLPVVSTRSFVLGGTSVNDLAQRYSGKEAIFFQVLSIQLSCHSKEISSGISPHSLFHSSSLCSQSRKLGHLHVKSWLLHVIMKEVSGILERFFNKGDHEDKKKNLPKNSRWSLVNLSDGRGLHSYQGGFSKLPVPTLPMNKDRKCSVEP